MFLEDRPFSQIPYWGVDLTEAYERTTVVWRHVIAAKEVRITSTNGTDISAKVGDWTKEEYNKFLMEQSLELVAFYVQNAILYLIRIRQKESS